MKQAKFQPESFGEIWLRRLADRISEPLHLNLASFLVALLGSYKTKIAFDLVPRRHYAYGLLHAAEQAKKKGVGSITAIEFGVAAGGGLLNLCEIAKHLTPLTGVNFRILGFDTGRGLPPPHDYRDHPELFRTGEFCMDRQRLARSLPSNATLILGELKDTVARFTTDMNAASPLGFVAMDVDYYSSTKDALAVLSDPDSTKYLPLPVIYLDDITDESQNGWCGELLAVREFNEEQPMRKIEQDRFLRSRRVFKHAMWLDQIHLLHVLDHPLMHPESLASSNGQATALAGANRFTDTLNS